MSVWCACTDKAAHANDPHPEADWVLTTGPDGHIRPEPPPPDPFERLASERQERIDAAATFAQGKANSAVARGDYDERRAWLDLLILLGVS